MFPVTLVPSRSKIEYLESQQNKLSDEKNERDIHEVPSRIISLVYQQEQQGAI
jgi:hypothetical protein